LSDAHAGEEEEGEEKKDRDPSRYALRMTIKVALRMTLVMPNEVRHLS